MKKKILIVGLVLSLSFMGGCSNVNKPVDFSKKYEKVMSVKDTGQLKEELNKVRLNQSDPNEVAKMFLNDCLNKNYENMLSYISLDEGISFANADNIKSHVNSSDLIRMNYFIGHSEEINMNNVNIDCQVFDDYCDISYEYENKKEDTVYNGSARLIKEDENYVLDCSSMYMKDKVHLLTAKDSELYINGILVKDFKAKEDGAFLDTYDIAGITTYSTSVQCKLPNMNLSTKTNKVRDVLENSKGNVMIEVEEDKQDKVVSDLKKLYNDLISDVAVKKISLDEMKKKYLTSDVSQADAENLYNGIRRELYIDSDVDKESMFYIKEDVTSVNVTRVVTQDTKMQGKPSICYYDANGSIAIYCGIETHWENIKEKNGFDFGGEQIDKKILNVFVRYDDKNNLKFSRVTDRLYYFCEFGILHDNF